jgi:4-amino-4-deoxy-L-arabinose transferase-like glycosyltransferase
MSQDNASQPFRRKSGLVTVVAVGFLVKLAILAVTASIEPRIADERDYLVLARSLASGEGFAFPNGPTSLRPPLYPGFVASVWALAGHESVLAVRFAQVVVGLLTAVLAYHVARALYDERSGVLAAALTTFYPALVFAQGLLLTETLFAFFVMAMVASVVAVFRRPHFGFAALAGVSLGAAALTRSILYPFPAVLAVILLWWLPASLRRRAGLALVLCVSYGLVIGPWAIRNTRLQGVPVLVDTMGGLNLRMGNYEHTPHDRMWDAVSQQGERSWIVGLPAHPEGGGDWTEGLKERWARSRALEFMLSHPGLTAWRSAIKFGDFWALDRDFVAGVHRGLYAPPLTVTALVGGLLLVAYPVALALGILGAWLVPPRDRHGRWLLLVVVGFVCALHAVVFAHPRYRLPMMPLLLIFAAPAISRRSWQGVDWQSWQGRGAALTLASAAALWVVQIVWRDWPAIRPLVMGDGL